MPDYRVIAEGLRFPEGPVALPDGSILFVEIARGTLCRVRPGAAVEVVAHLGGGPNGAALGPDGWVYVCNNGGFEWHEVEGLLVPGLQPADYSGGRIERVHLASGRVERVVDSWNGIGLRGPNDLAFDRTGGLWFTDNGKRRAADEDAGAVYYLDPFGRLERKLFPVAHANGIALSPSEDRLYVAETMAGRIWGHRLEAPGQVVAPRGLLDHAALVHGAPGFRLFDSMAVEACGNICVATLPGEGITVLSPQGEVVEVIPVPDPIPTNICFGGPDLKTAYITLSGTGKLIEMPWPRPGLPLNFLNRS